MSSTLTAAGDGAPSEAARGIPLATGTGALWLGVLLPPASWAVDLVGSQMLSRWVSARGTRVPLRLLMLTCLAALVLGMVLCARARRNAKETLASRVRTTGLADEVTGPQGAEDLTNELTSRLILASWGLAVAAFFLLLMMAQAYPVFVLNTGEIT